MSTESNVPDSISYSALSERLGSMPLSPRLPVLPLGNNDDSPRGGYADLQFAVAQLVSKSEGGDPEQMLTAGLFLVAMAEGFFRTLSDGIFEKARELNGNDLVKAAAAHAARDYQYRARIVHGVVEVLAGMHEQSVRERILEESAKVRRPLTREEQVQLSLSDPLLEALELDRAAVEAHIQPSAI